MSTDVFEASMQRLAYLPPPKSYNDQQNITYVTTIDGDRIATRTTSYLGRPYVSGETYDPEHRFVIFSHGNGDDIGTCDDYVRELAQTHKCNVVTYDYVNYGCSSKGYTTEKNMHAAITAVFDYVTNQLRVPAECVMLFGKSLGTAPTVYLSAQPFAEHIQGVTLVSPLASGVRAVLPAPIASRKLLSALDSFFCPSIDLIQKTQVPVFIIHGFEDKVINVVNARILASHLSQRSKYTPLFVHAGHNDIESTHPITLREYLNAFFRHCDARQRERDVSMLVEYDSD